MEDVSDDTVKLIGVAEIAAAIGLVLPPIVDVAPWLAAVAASGLATVMALAALTHVRRKEPAGVAVTLLLGALAVFVAIGRYGPEAF